MSNLRADNIGNRLGTKSVSSDTVVDGTCRAWVHITTTGGVPAVTRAFNVTSVTDLGLGDYQVNFTNAMPSATYAAIVTTAEVTNGTTYAIPYIVVAGLLTTSVEVQTRGSGATSTAADPPRTCVAIFDRP